MEGSGSLGFSGVASVTVSYKYIPTGNLCLSSLIDFGYEKYYYCKFKERDTAWVKEKASKGILEPITIKRLLPIMSKYKDGVEADIVSHVLYLDTFNSHWNDNLLVNHQEAINLATLYYQKQIAKAQLLIRQNNKHCYGE